MERTVARESSLPRPPTATRLPVSRQIRPQPPTPARMKAVYGSMEYREQSRKLCTAIPRPRLASTREPWRPRPLVGLTSSSTLPSIPTSSLDVGLAEVSTPRSQDEARAHRAREARSTTTEQDPRLVYTSRPNLFWAGRYSTIRDQLRTQQLDHKSSRTRCGTQPLLSRKNVRR